MAPRLRALVLAEGSSSIPGPTRWLTTACNSSSRDSRLSSDLHGHHPHQSPSLPASYTSASTQEAEAG